MESNIIKKYKFIPLWQEEKELSWLADMSKDGWHLTGKDFVTYTFQKGESCEYTYCFEYKSNSKDDIDECIQIYKDSGWEYIAYDAGWHYFRADLKSQIPEAYNNIESRQKRLKQILAMMILIGIATFAIILTNIFIFFKLVDNFTYVPLVLIIMWSVSLLVVLLNIYTSIRIGLRLRKLNKSIYE